jgi:hypothetical protein
MKLATQLNLKEKKTRPKYLQEEKRKNRKGKKANGKTMKQEKEREESRSF